MNKVYLALSNTIRNKNYQHFHPDFKTEVTNHFINYFKDIEKEM